MVNRVRRITIFGFAAVLLVLLALSALFAIGSGNEVVSEAATQAQVKTTTVGVDSEQKRSGKGFNWKFLKGIRTAASGLSAGQLTPAEEKGLSAGRLTPAEEKVFIDEVYGFFGADAWSLSAEKQRDSLSNLNARGEAGLRSIVSQIASSPTDTDQVHVRMAMVEYLRYRLRWDPQAKTMARDLIRVGSPEGIPKNVRAMKIQEFAELARLLVRWDASELSLLKDLEDPIARRWIASHMQSGLQDAGVLANEAENMVRAHYPEFGFSNQSTL